jgi:hypothetical protein
MPTLSNPLNTPYLLGIRRSWLYPLRMDKPESIIDFFGQMLSKREYFIPLIAAQYQFPNHYYGLTSAALLEDLFVDAAINFKNQEHHGLQLERPERTNDENLTTDAKGEKGWDYKYDGQNYSHKVGSKVQSIALLWDATYELPEDSTYSYPSPIVMVLSNYKNKNATLTLKTGEAFQITPLSQFRSKPFIQGQQILIVSRTFENTWKLLEVINLGGGESELNETLKLQTIWQKMLEHWANDQAANSIEIFVTKSTKKKEIPVDLTSRDVTIDFKALPGVYLFPKESLQKVKVTKNNRAILLPTEKVQELMDISCQKGNFTYLPNWFTYFATNRSVDLYLVQRAEYDRLNSAARA